jgi:ABC-type branched-subunit amino acid transport system substrate-binding protein
LTGWNRRANAASFSKYFLYSDQVVAAIVRSSPRASAGLSRLAASASLPTIVCASSMNSTIGAATP